MWRVVYFFISFIIAFISCFYFKSFGYKTLIIFLLSTILIFLIEFFVIRKRSSKTILAFFISFFLTLISVILTIQAINIIGIILTLNGKLIILFIEGYLIFSIIIAFIPNVTNIFKLTNTDKNKTAKILDTSVIVDGRIYDIA